MCGKLAIATLWWFQHKLWCGRSHAASLVFSKDAPPFCRPLHVWGQSMGGDVWSLVAVWWLCFGTHDFCCSRVVCVFQHRRRVKQVCITTITHTTIPSVFDSLALGIWIFVLNTLFWLLALVYVPCSEDWQEHLVCGASLSCPVSNCPGSHFHQWPSCRLWGGSKVC